MTDTNREIECLTKATETLARTIKELGDSHYEFAQAQFKINRRCSWTLILLSLSMVVGFSFISVIMSCHIINSRVRNASELNQPIIPVTTTPTAVTIIPTIAAINCQRENLLFCLELCLITSVCSVCPSRICCTKDTNGVSAVGMTCGGD